MSLQDVFMIVGIAYFSVWLIITFFLAAFIIYFALKIKQTIKKAKAQSKPIKIALSLVQSALFRKVLLFAGSSAFIAQTVSGLFSSEKE